MALDKAQGFTKKAMQHRRDARTLDKTNPSAAKKHHKAADKASTQATIQRENIRGKSKKK